MQVAKLPGNNHCDSLSRILVAGIGGASLGTEVLKSLQLANRYEVFGCDISEFAYGHYVNEGIRTFVVKNDNYVDSVLRLCIEERINIVIPGGETPTALLSSAGDRFTSFGTLVASNASSVVNLCTNKEWLFQRIHELGLPSPWTIAVNKLEDFESRTDIRYPCVIKPAMGSGGSRLVFLASNKDEAFVFLSYVLKNTETALVQEYIPLTSGEFTVGVLSLPNGNVAGTLAMQRLFNAKLSVSIQTEAGIISSGYSQGLIDCFPEVCSQAKTLAQALGSTGPMNIQGRMHSGIFLPFEANPRFSASTYLRALAGFNEVDIYLRYLLDKESVDDFQIKSGYYLRSLTERCVSGELIKA